MGDFLFFLLPRVRPLLRFLYNWDKNCPGDKNFVPSLNYIPIFAHT